MSVTLAIVGLGTVGAEFLEEILKHRDKGIAVSCVAEIEETAGKQIARKAGIEIATIDEILGKAAAIDVVFDLTGSKTVRRLLRDGLGASGNRHTVVVPETVSHLVWGLMTNQTLPAPADHYVGY
jgi:predicted dinucleotide-utilizing enzyme